MRTAPVPGSDPEADAGPAPTLGPYTRVTVLAPHVRADLALPADVPVAELVPMLVELLGGPRDGQRPLPWRLTGVTGGVLPADASLDELEVYDGELLRIGPVDALPPPPVFDDPVDAVAATAGSPRPPPGRAAVVAVAAATAGAVALAAADGRAAALATVTAAVGAVAALAAAVWRARSRPAGGDAAEPTPRPVDATACAVVAVPLAAAAGFAALVTAPPAARLLLAVTAAGVAAAAGQILLRRVEPVLVGAVALAVPAAVAGAVQLRLGTPVPAVAAIAGTVGLVAIPLLPRAALRLAGVPRPQVPADAGELLDADTGPDVLPPGELAARAALARGYLAGLVGAAAVLAGVGAVLTGTADGWASTTLAVLTVAVLALRSRGPADPAPARVLLGTAGAAAFGLAGLIALGGGIGGPLTAGVALVLAALSAAALGGRRPSVSPVLRRAVDLLDGLLVAASVPLALGVAGVYAWVRTW